MHEHPVAANAPESVVPDEDNPVRGLWRLGFWLLPDGLWGIDPRRNPALAYAPWARLGVGGVALHASPWAALAALAAAGFWRWPDEALNFFLFPLDGFIPIPPPYLLLVACLVPQLMLAGAVRRALESSAMQEARASGLSAEEVLQGILLKPLLVHNLALFGASIAMVAAIWVSVGVLTDDGWPTSAVPLGYYLVIVQPPLASCFMALACWTALRFQLESTLGGMPMRVVLMAFVPCSVVAMGVALVTVLVSVVGVVAVVALVFFWLDGGKPAFEPLSQTRFVVVVSTAAILGFALWPLYFVLIKWAAGKAFLSSNYEARLRLFKAFEARMASDE